jgi:hypothetical protein
MRLRTILIAVVVVVASFAGATFAMQWLAPGPAPTADRPAPAAVGPTPMPVLADVPPLPAATGTSVIVAPVSITLTAIRDLMEAEAPRTFVGQRDVKLSQVITNGEVSWNIARGPLAATGRSDALTVSSALDGTVRATGHLSPQAGNIGNAIGGLLGGNVGRSMEKMASRPLDQRADVRGNVTITAHPVLTSAWRVAPNLTATVALADTPLSFAGVKLNVTKEVKPLLDRTVNEQLAKAQARLSNDPFLETAARREWAKLCRSIPLGKSGDGKMPNLWLEVRPTRAFSAQPRIDAAAVALTLGVESETRILPTETKPDCPFPASLEILPNTDQGGIRIAVPVDVPFTEINRLIDAQLARKSLKAKNDSFQAEIKSAQVVPSGNRLLITLRLDGSEKRSWFGVGGEATIYVWGRPVLDREHQQVRLADLSLDIQSEAALGLLGSAARTARPVIEAALAEYAVIDLRPYAANARKSIDTALADFRSRTDGVTVTATVADLRLTDIAFDADTLRVVAEADGSAAVAITSLPNR